MKDETMVMPKQSPSKFLCLNCIHASECGHHKNFCVRISYCKDYEPHSKENSGKNSSDDKFIGLCKTCKNRLHCTLPKSEGGVWHCEHYC